MNRISRDTMLRIFVYFIMILFYGISIYTTSHPSIIIAVAVNSFSLTAYIQLLLIIHDVKFNELHTCINSTQLMVFMFPILGLGFFVIVLLASIYIAIHDKKSLEKAIVSIIRSMQRTDGN